MIAMVNVKKKQSFLQDDYLLFTPETHWYPTASLNFYPSNPARIKVDFTYYTLRVKNRSGLNVISQGRKITEQDTTLFLPEHPLTGLTLAIGNYQSDSLKVDSVIYITHYFKGNDYYKKDLAELKDTLPQLISGIMRDLETSFSTRYPFSSLSLLEVPVNYYSHPGNNTQTRSEVQPGLILLPEKLSTLSNAGFSKRFDNQKKRMQRDNQIITDKELKVRIFNDFIRSTFIRGTSFVWTNNGFYNEPSRYQLGPSFYFHKNNFYSSDYPVINAVFESHLQQVSGAERGPDYSLMSGSLNENDKANLVLRNKSFKELLEENPRGDTVRVVLAVKGDWFFNLLRSKAGIDEFNKWFTQYCEANSFRRIEISKCRDDLMSRFGFDFYPYLNTWFNGKEQPGFLFSNLQAGEIVINDRSRYLVSFIATNPTNVPGLFNISFRGEGSGGAGRGGRQMSGAFQPGDRPGERMMQGRGMEAADISKIVMLEAGESKKISLTNDFQPRAMTLNTLFALNIPGTINMPVYDVVKLKKGSEVLNEEERLSDAPKFSEPDEIVTDNEDAGFSSNDMITVSPLKRLFGITNRQKDTYMQISAWNRPEYWQPVVQTSYFGKYIRSAVYKRAGAGDKSITWSAKINEPGYYDVYCYIGKSLSGRRLRTDRGGGPANTDDDQNEARFSDLHYKVFHNDGVEEIIIEYGNAQPEWNSLGRFYISSDSAMVELTDQSEGRMVLGDAVKWVRVR